MRSALHVLVLAVLAAACADAGNDAPDDQTASDAQAAAAAAAPAPPAEPETPYGWMPAGDDSTRAAGTLGDVTPAPQVTAALSEWEIQLSKDTIRAGEVTIALENRGDRPHTIEVRNDRAGRWRSLPIPPGGRVTMSMPMSPANYEVISAEDTYVERGMRALLIVR